MYPPSRQQLTGLGPRRVPISTSNFVVSPYPVRPPVAHPNAGCQHCHAFYGNLVGGDPNDVPAQKVVQSSTQEKRPSTIKETTKEKSKRLHESLLEAEQFDSDYAKGDRVLLSPFISSKDSAESIPAKELQEYREAGKWLQISQRDPTKKIYYLCMLKLFSKNDSWLSRDTELTTNQPDCNKNILGNGNVSAPFAERVSNLSNLTPTRIYDAINSRQGNFRYYLELYNFACRMIEFVFKDKRFTDMSDQIVKSEVVHGLFSFVKFVNEYSLEITSKCEQDDVIPPVVVIEADNNLIYLMYELLEYYQKTVSEINKTKTKIANIRNVIDNLAEYNRGKKMAMTSLIPTEKALAPVVQQMKTISAANVPANKLADLETEYKKLNLQFQKFERTSSKLEESLKSSHKNINNAVIKKIGENIGRYF